MSYVCTLQADVSFTQGTDVLTIRRPNFSNALRNDPVVKEFELPNGGTKTIVCDGTIKEFELVFTQTGYTTLSEYVYRNLGKAVTYVDHYNDSYTVFFKKGPRLVERLDDCLYDIYLNLRVDA